VISASRAKRLSTRQIGDTNNKSEILRCDPMQNLERQHGDLVDDALRDAQPVQADQRICYMIEASKSTSLQELNDIIIYIYLIKFTYVIYFHIYIFCTIIVMYDFYNK